MSWLFEGRHRGLETSMVGSKKPGPLGGSFALVVRTAGGRMHSVAV